MTRLVRILALQVAQQARYDRLHWAIPGYVLALLALVPFAAHMALGSGTRASLEVGLLLQWWIACAAGGWLGLRAVGLDLDRRTAAIVLSGPVDPGTWLLGRALGAALVQAALVLGLQLGWVIIAVWRGIALQPELLAWALSLWLEGAIVGGLTALLSTRTRPLVAAGATAALWVSGHLAGEYSRIASEAGLAGVATVIFFLVPDLDMLDLQTPLVTGAPLDGARLLTALGYALLWLVALGALTTVSVRTRDLA